MSIIDKVLGKFTEWALRQPEGSRVMGYTIADYIDGSPYLTRVLFPRLLGFRPMLHHFHRPDGDRALHNHPWSWAFSIVLRGSYLEERRLDPEQVHGTGASPLGTREVRRFNVLTAGDYHRVVELRGDVWTVFVAGPSIQEWGFLDRGIFTPWRKYIDAKRLEHRIHRAAREELEELAAENNVRRQSDGTMSESDNWLRGRLLRRLGYIHTSGPVELVE